MQVTGSAGVTEIEQQTPRKVVWWLVPFLIFYYLLAFIDRGNMDMASLQMNHGPGLTTRVFGSGSSLFLVPYFLLEVPSSLVLQCYDAHIWIARTMITWDLISAATALVSSPASFYALCFLLGAAKTGLFSGVLLHLSCWIPAAHRVRIVVTFMAAISAVSFIGSPISAVLLQMDGFAGLRGWH